MYKPNPAPSPAGLVVKKASKMRFFIVSLMVKTPQFYCGNY
jgi:hypothetical protein